MKINLKTAILYFLIGIGFGGIINSLTLMLNGAEGQTTSQIGTVVIVSGCMGLVSLIFELDKPAFAWRLGAHFLAVFSLVILLNRLLGITGNLFRLDVLGQFLLIYLLVWAVVIYMTQQRVAKINEKLRQKRNLT
ncbi:Protein of unknown function [Streptococcus henryi]|uniref:DUF3021 domain-containing protein n=1 Tax=Streptococcus henryi TaxID=439219 RepID=A0A1G6D2E2_9STRE|nr:DUF3021 family protein [Streptococcus henryi]SDB39219.1 Protein of unknown function [Streptococcus henryi]